MTPDEQTVEQWQGQLIEIESAAERLWWQAKELRETINEHLNGTESDGKDEMVAET
jgi:hypothetical protein